MTKYTHLALMILYLYTSPPTFPVIWWDCFQNHRTGSREGQQFDWNHRQPSNAIGTSPNLKLTSIPCFHCYFLSCVRLVERHGYPPGEQRVLGIYHTWDVTSLHLDGACPTDDSSHRVATPWSRCLSWSHPRRSPPKKVWLAANASHVLDVLEEIRHCKMKALGIRHSGVEAALGIRHGGAVAALGIRHGGVEAALGIRHGGWRQHWESDMVVVGNTGNQTWWCGGSTGNQARWVGGNTGNQTRWGGGSTGNQTWWVEAALGIRHWGGSSTGNQTRWGGGSTGNQTRWGGCSAGNQTRWSGGSTGIRHGGWRQHWESDMVGGGSTGNQTRWGGGSTGNWLGTIDSILNLTIYLRLTVTLKLIINPINHAEWKLTVRAVIGLGQESQVGHTRGVGEVAKVAQVYPRK